MTAVERVQLDVAPTQALTERLSRVVRSLVRVRPARWFVLVCTGLSPVLLVGGWLIADPLQPASYSGALALTSRGVRGVNSEQ